jgi:hypothetical protein
MIERNEKKLNQELPCQNRWLTGALGLEVGECRHFLGLNKKKIIHSAPVAAANRPRSMSGKSGRLSQPHIGGDNLDSIRHTSR